MRLKDIGEFGFIRRIRDVGKIRCEGVVKGIGDDCAVIDINGPDYLLVTTDLLMERVHFRRDWGTSEQLGGKALAVNLSDIAACGGIPRDAFVSLAIPDDIELAWLDGFYRGMSRMAQAYDVNILGGDTTGSKRDLVINITLTGVVPREQVLFRHTARPGDLIALTGRTGVSAAGCEILLSGRDPKDETAQELILHHLEPRPHVQEGRFLAESGVCTAAIDVSDGLSSDLTHICEESRLGAIIFERLIPIDQALLTFANCVGSGALRWVLHGGEDYVLLVALEEQSVSALSPQAESQGITLTVIGQFREQPGIELVRADGRGEPLYPRGWDHFRSIIPEGSR